ncbi:MAG: EF-hand domain-containing protein, partial [Candidatus Marinimicrobia bacterium]|nr:EF-hand domain-containing protein [Candidatus Neomarinimicrobiota bacterium]
MVNQSHKLSGPFLIELKNKFREIAGSDNKIDRQEFKNSLVIENEKIINRIFDIFDKDENNVLDINEFINGIETLIESTNAQKIKFAFDIHDFDGSGDIDKDELKILIKNILIENNLDFDTNQVDLIVDEFFRYGDVDKNGRIDFDEFLNLIKKYPDLINSLAANPVAWFRNNKSRKDYQTTKKVVSNISRVQVQNLNVLQWLLVPRLIYFYNIIINRNKNNELISIKSLKILPEKNISFSFDKPSWFKFQAG